jgi:hypothetical protein
MDEKQAAMPFIMSCPGCGRKGEIPGDLHGEKVECPECGMTFVAKAESTTSRPDVNWTCQELGEEKGAIENYESWCYRRRGSNKEWATLSNIEIPNHAHPQLFALITLAALTVTVAYLASCLARTLIP